MKAWAFSGQGSQHKGMGGGLFDQFPAECSLADRVLGYSVRELCLDNPGNRLGSTQFAQPALFVVNALSALARMAAEGPPGMVAGHSLGELNALLAAGCYDFETGLRLVKLRGSLMGEASGGQMLAVLGMPSAELAELMAAERSDDVDIANYNSPTQTVLSGPPESITRLAVTLKARPGVRCLPLNVSAAFHSRYMADAARRFTEYLATVRFVPPRMPVVANSTGHLYRPGEIGAVLGRQVDSPVRWQACMQTMLTSGVTELIEVGPGRILAGLWREALAHPGQASTPAVSTRLPAASLPAASPPAAERFLAGPPLVADDPAARLGSAEFRADYGIRYAYLAGSMFRGVASVDLVRRLGESGLLGFFGAGGLKLGEVDDAIASLKASLGPSGWGMNLIHSLDDPAAEQATVDLYLKHEVRFVEAAAYLQVTAPLVQLRFAGARLRDGVPEARVRIVAKVSRPETAAAFLRPAPPELVAALVRRGALTEAEAAIAARLPMSEDICVESDSAGHTDAGVALTLLPALSRLRDELQRANGYPRAIRVGAAGGLGAPEAVAAAFVLGADFVLTGSVNQCTPEAGTSDMVKDMLAALDVQDTAYAPAGDMFEVGSRVQVVRKGTLFAARANKLYDLYRRHGSLDEIEPRLRETLERNYFRRTMDEVWQQVREYHRQSGHSEELERAEREPRHKMALVFRWYFAHSAALAAQGSAQDKVNFQVHCGPAMGSFNRLVVGTELADWRNRHVDQIAELLMRGAAERLQNMRISEHIGA